MLLLGFGQGEVTLKRLGAGREGDEDTGILSGCGRTMNVDGGGVGDGMGELICHDLGEVAEGEAERAGGRCVNGGHHLNTVEAGSSFDDALNSGKDDLSADGTQRVISGVDINISEVVEEVNGVGVRDLLGASDRRCGGGKRDQEGPRGAGSSWTMKIGGQGVLDVVSDSPGQDLGFGIVEESSSSRGCAVRPVNNLAGIQSCGVGAGDRFVIPIGAFILGSQQD